MVRGAVLPRAAPCCFMLPWGCGAVEPARELQPSSAWLVLNPSTPCLFASPVHIRTTIPHAPHHPSSSRRKNQQFRGGVGKYKKAKLPKNLDVVLPVIKPTQESLHNPPEDMAVSATETTPPKKENEEQRRERDDIIGGHKNPWLMPTTEAFGVLSGQPSISSCALNLPAHLCC